MPGSISSEAISFFDHCEEFSTSHSCVIIVLHNHLGYENLKFKIFWWYWGLTLCLLGNCSTAWATSPVLSPMFLYCICMSPIPFQFLHVILMDWKILLFLNQLWCLMTCSNTYLDFFHTYSSLSYSLCKRDTFIVMPFFQSNQFPFMFFLDSHSSKNFLFTTLILILLLHSTF
jgi:hypothetical protein